MGDKYFWDAWKEIYRLSEESDELLPEETIYQAFLSRIPENQVKEFKEIYQRWHGGFGSATARSSNGDYY